MSKLMAVVAIIAFNIAVLTVAAVINELIMRMADHD